MYSKWPFGNCLCRFWGKHNNKYGQSWWTVMSEYSRFYVNMVAPSLVDFFGTTINTLFYMCTLYVISKKSDLVQRSILALPSISVSVPSWPGADFCICVTTKRYCIYRRQTTRNTTFFNSMYLLLCQYIYIILRSYILWLFLLISILLL